MSDIVCLLTKPAQEIECLCFDHKPCDIRIDDGGHMVCRHGSNETIIDGIAKIVCPIEIERESEKWDAFLKSESNAGDQNAKKTK
ncbi:MAG: hypothetical protein NWE92_12130 [Candidatus Bathyarchaeota archaeon]|nr:hypothetical protein [Candidatus Bathyarchaeota archaeon]